jgi:hypothetical protein
VVAQRRQQIVTTTDRAAMTPKTDTIDEPIEHLGFDKASRILQRVPSQLANPTERPVVPLVLLPELRPLSSRKQSLFGGGAFNGA